MLHYTHNVERMIWLASITLNCERRNAMDGFIDTPERENFVMWYLPFPLVTSQRKKMGGGIFPRVDMPLTHRFECIIGD